MKYQVEDDTQANRDKLRSERQHQLYKMVFQDISALIDLFVPGDKTLRVKNHIKSIIYNLIELKMGTRVKKF